MNASHSIFRNYLSLVNKVDAHVDRLVSEFPKEIVCAKGCDECCLAINLFPVEAFFLAQGYETLDQDTKTAVEKNIHSNTEKCPLLINCCCVLYDFRPVICRTHGYPVTMEKDGKIQIDFCPKNFKTVKQFKKEYLLSLEQLNTMLAAVNQHFLESIETDQLLPERISVRDIPMLLT